MVVDPVQRFFAVSSTAALEQNANEKFFLMKINAKIFIFFLWQEVNDPYKNDETSNIDQKTLDALWELGAFGIQVPTGEYKFSKHF